MTRPAFRHCRSQKMDAGDGRGTIGNRFFFWLLFQDAFGVWRLRSVTVAAGHSSRRGHTFHSVALYPALAPSTLPSHPFSRAQIPHLSPQLMQTPSKTRHAELPNTNLLREGISRVHFVFVITLSLFSSQHQQRIRNKK